jgi:hypothetical protein
MSNLNQALKTFFLILYKNIKLQFDYGSLTFFFLMKSYDGPLRLFAE